MSKVDWSKAPDGATHYGGGAFWIEAGSNFGFRKYKEDRRMFDFSIDKPQSFTDYEQRPQQWPENEERVDIIGTNGGDGMHYDEFREDTRATVLKPTYNRDIIGLDGTKTTVDVYRVLDAFKTESPAIDHAVKKLLCAGIRHQKDRKQDLEEAIKSIQAELLLMSQR